MYKIHYNINKEDILDGEKVDEYEDYDEALAHVINLCSQPVEFSKLNVKMTKVVDGKEEVLFKTHKSFVGDILWIAKLKINKTICTECDGNGIIEINEFRQTEDCDHCNGVGQILERTKLLEPSGPYKVRRINRKIGRQEKDGFLHTVPEEDWVVLEHPGGEKTSAHLMFTFDTEEEAKKHIAEHNQIKEAENTAMATGTMSSKKRSYDDVEDFDELF